MPGLQTARTSRLRRAQDCLRAWICTFTPRDAAGSKCHRPKMSISTRILSGSVLGSSVKTHSPRWYNLVFRRTLASLANVRDSLNNFGRHRPLLERCRPTSGPILGRDRPMSLAFDHFRGDFDPIRTQSTKSGTTSTHFGRNPQLLERARPSQANVGQICPTLAFVASSFLNSARSSCVADDSPL